MRNGLEFFMGSLALSMMIHFFVGFVIGNDR